MKILFIFSCSGMFRNVPECSGMFRVPGFIDGRSQWGGGFYGYRLKFRLFYGYRLIFSVTVNKTLKINSFCFKELNINKPVFVLTLKQNKGLRIISGWNKLFFWKILTFNRSCFIQYFTSNIILRIEMSTVNIKIIFVKKQKQTRERSTQGRGANSFITEM